MRFWFARGTEISLREQLFAQVVPAVLSGDVVPVFDKKVVYRR